MGLTPFFDLTHNYTGESRPLNSPRLPVCLDFRGLAKGHRSLSERGIIAGKSARSTPYFQSREADPGPAAICRRLRRQMARNYWKYSGFAVPAARPIGASRPSGHLTPAHRRCFSVCHCW